MALPLHHIFRFYYSTTPQECQLFFLMLHDVLFSLVVFIPRQKISKDRFFGGFSGIYGILNVIEPSQVIPFSLKADWCYTKKVDKEKEK